MITEDYISFEIAKLLKDKGFNELTAKSYPYFEGKDYKYDISCPTLQMAMKWLREVHNVNIEIHYNKFGKNYKYLIIYKPEVLDDIRSLGVFYYYEEACNEAIKYCLKNLI